MHNDLQRGGSIFVLLKLRSVDKPQLDSQMSKNIEQRMDYTHKDEIEERVMRMRVN